jgi:NADH:ubiquinone oxidoreductase subunit F (NADH-binding)
MNETSGTSTGTTRRLLGHPPIVSLAEHRRTFGPVPTRVDGLIDEVARAGLRGRGGARFPTDVKLRSVAGARRPLVVANACEGEPASAKDKVLVGRLPHLVLDGAIVAARAIGAEAIHVCIERNRPDLADIMGRAIAERDADRSERVTITLHRTPNRYVSGEESALVHWLNGGEAKPTTVPPRPFERGVNRRPTLVDNVETLAHLALIARAGADWYRSVGTDTDPGTYLLTISGHVNRPGVYEVAGGDPLAATIEAAGGSMAETQAVLIGGYFGTWIPTSIANHTTLDVRSLDWAGAALGCGVVVALGHDACGLLESARVTRWLADQNAGQCGPCVHGLDELARDLTLLARGQHVERARTDIGELLPIIAGRGACRHPDGVVRFVASSLRAFREHLAFHEVHGPCAAHPPVLPTPTTGGWR